MVNQQRRAEPTSAKPSPWPFLGRAIVGILVVYVFAHVDRWFHLWPADLKFPSGHMAFAVSAATSIALLNRRWLYLLMPILLLQAFLLVRLHYHVWFDVVAAWFLALPLTYLCHALMKPASATNLQTAESASQMKV